MADSTNVVYRHIRKDNNKVFYIGIGKLPRAYSKHGRSNFWKRITNKTDYNIEIIADNLLWEDACDLEMLLISEYGRINNNTGVLCNLTDGGEGTLNVKISEETRNKLKINGNSERNLLQLREMAKNRVGYKKPKTKVDNKKYVLNLITGIFYITIREAAKAHNIHEDTLWKWLTLKRKNKSNLILI